MIAPAIGVVDVKLLTDFLVFGLDPEQYSVCPFLVTPECLGDFNSWRQEEHGARALVVATQIASSAVVDAALMGQPLALVIHGTADDLLLQDLMPIDQDLNDGSQWSPLDVTPLQLAQRVHEVFNASPLDEDAEEEVEAAIDELLDQEAAPEPFDVSAGRQEPLDILDPRTRDLPLHLRNRKGAARLLPEERAQSERRGIDLVDAFARAPAAPRPRAPAPPPPNPIEPVPEELASAVRASSSGLCEALRPFLATGQQVFRAAARQAIGLLPPGEWAVRWRQEAAQLCVQEMELAAFGLALAAGWPPKRDAGAQAVQRFAEGG